jgi:hypothetical protein
VGDGKTVRRIWKVLKVPNEQETTMLKEKLEAMLREVFGDSPGFALFLFFPKKEGEKSGMVCLTDAPSPLVMASTIAPYLAVIAEANDDETEPDDKQKPN